jgi:hypothetical protein
MIISNDALIAKFIKKNQRRKMKGSDESRMAWIYIIILLVLLILFA